MAVHSGLIINNPLLRRFIYERGEKRARYIYGLISGYLRSGDKILDLGAGNCNIARLLIEKGFRLTPLDIANISLVNSIKPDIFDGKHLPYPDNSFDVTLIIAVLHHTKDSGELLEEAKRVSKRLIIIEDIYHNRFEKIVTRFLDSLQNQEFTNHPHANRTDEEWRIVFKNLDLRLLEAKWNRWYYFIKHGIYYLDKN